MTSSVGCCLAAHNGKKASNGTHGCDVQGKELSWEERYEQLVEYKEEHGDTRVPQKYEPNPALGRWGNCAVLCDACVFFVVGVIDALITACTGLCRY